MKFVRPLADITVTEKQDIYLECEINKPGLKPTWKVDGSKVSASERIQLLSEGNVHKLIIKEADLDDENVYTVTFDDATSTASVIVDGEYIYFVFTTLTMNKNSREKGYSTGVT